MKAIWAVVTPAGTIIFKGDKPSCRDFIRRELAEDDTFDYLRIVKAS